MLKTLAAAAIAALAALRSAAEEELVKVRFVTDWKAQAEHGGFTRRRPRDLREIRPDVEIVRRAVRQRAPPARLGEADFAIGSNSFIPPQHDRRRRPATAVASIFQKDPQVLITHPATTSSPLRICAASRS